jgi:maleylacetoacetate isomerase/maleylpyruvate isomerase
MTARLTLYSYFRSSTSYRVRIGLHLKGLAFETVPVHMLRDGGQHRAEAYRALNPQMRLPTLLVEDGARRDVLIQSPAILEWLDEAYPEPKLLPADPIARAHCRAIAAVVCDIHPVNNLGILTELKTQFGADQDRVDMWYRKWVEDGFAAIEQLLGDGPFACGEQVTLADVHLVPQVYNARRYKTDLSAYPKIVAVDQACNALPAFAAAAPEAQPDAPK